MNTTQAVTILDQIGRVTLLAISGGRIRYTGQAIILPVSNGYTVEIEYDEGRDTYTVTRVYTRGVKRWIKGQIDNVYCDQISDIAYEASCFRSNGFGAHRVA